MSWTNDDFRNSIEKCRKIRGGTISVWNESQLRIHNNQIRDEKKFKNKEGESS